MRILIGFIKSVHGRIREEEGATVVETALACTAFFAMLLGSFQLCLALYAFHYVDESAREASRYLMVRGSTSCTNTSSLSNCGITDPTAIQAYFRGISYPGIQAGKLTLTPTWLSASANTPTSWTACGGACNSPGNQVQVIATYPFTISVPLVPHLSLSLTSTSKMVISQ
jgi:Flp pilus assembly protein TadG